VRRGFRHVRVLKDRGDSLTQLLAQCQRRRPAQVSAGRVRQSPRDAGLQPAAENHAGHVEGRCAPADPEISGRTQGGRIRGTAHNQRFQRGREHPAADVAGRAPVGRSPAHAPHAEESATARRDTDSRGGINAGRDREAEVRQVHAPSHLQRVEEAGTVPDLTIKPVARAGSSTRL
jgi:hypothetical protein